jgi:hypothetical protein
MNKTDCIIAKAFELQGILSKMDESKTHSGLFDVLGKELRMLRLDYMKFHKKETLNKINDIVLKTQEVIDKTNEYESQQILELLKQF